MNKLMKAAAIGGCIWVWSDFCFALGKGTGMRGIKIANPDYWTKLKETVPEKIKGESAYRKACIKLAMDIADRD